MTPDPSMMASFSVKSSVIFLNWLPSTGSQIYVATFPAGKVALN